MLEAGRSHLSSSSRASITWQTGTRSSGRLGARNYSERLDHKRERGGVDQTLRSLHELAKDRDTAVADPRRPREPPLRGVRALLRETQHRNAMHASACLHLLQPLDVGCFGPLKQAYGRQLEDLMRGHVSHVSKLEFLCTFREAFASAMTPENLRAGFAKTGLVSHNPEKVLCVLNGQVRTPSPPNKCGSTARHWVSQTPRNTLEAASQSKLIKNRIASHLGSSPTPMLDAVDQFAKGTTAIMHEVTLLRAENSSLRKADVSLSKRRSAPKSRVRQGGCLSVKDAGVVLHQKSLVKPVQGETRSSKGQSTGTQPRPRHCRSCREAGHNSRTCLKLRNDMLHLC